MQGYKEIHMDKENKDVIANSYWISFIAFKKKILFKEKFILSL